MNKQQEVSQQVGLSTRILCPLVNGVSRNSRILSLFITGIWICLMVASQCFADSFTIVRMTPPEGSTITTGNQTFTAAISYSLTNDGSIVISDDSTSNVLSLSKGTKNATISLTTDIPASLGGRSYRINLLLSDNDSSYFSASKDVVYSVKSGSTQTTPTPKSVSPGATSTSTPNGNINQTITVPLSLPAGAKPLEMELISAGTFTMGSPDTDIDAIVTETNNGWYKNEVPQHKETINKPFYLGKYEVTQAQWQAVMGSNNSNWKGNNLPVETVSWNDVQTFIQKLNLLGQGTFRLPTEVEWEYSCRAGTQTRYYWGDDPNYTQIGDYVWYKDNSSSKTHEVGLKKPNAWGLFDMSGNIYEWCQNLNGDYSSVVYRGGSWYDPSSHCRSALRHVRPDYNMDTKNQWHGLRLVKEFNEKIVTVPLTLPSEAKALEMVLIPAGTFTMGDPNDVGGRYQISDQTIYKSFYIGKYEITQAQWMAVMGSNPSYFKSGNNYPVEQVSWDECQVFVQKLNALGQGTFRLPTEVEWEYACRAGTTTHFYWGDDTDFTQVNKFAWYTDDPEHPEKGKTHEAGVKLPNLWGLYDMSGNVWEWCVNHLYPNSSQQPIHGGSYFDTPAVLTSFIFNTHNTDLKGWNVGFRLVREDTYPSQYSTPTPTPTITPTPPINTGMEPFEFTVNMKIGPTNYKLLLGTNEQATDKYDPGLDVLSPPADPSGREAYFIVDDQKLWTDLREINTENRKWNLIISVPPKEESVIQWDSATITEDAYLIPMDAMGRPAGKSIDMKVESSINIAAQGGFVARKFYYQINFETVRPVTINYDLVKGWNLLSVPLNVDKEVTPDSVFGKLTPIWSYNPVISQYEIPLKFETHKGYWVYVAKNQSFAITGRQDNNLPITLISTWNLIGVNQPVLRSTEGIGVVWGFDNNTKKYVATAPTDYLEPQKGYWFQVNAPVSLFDSTPAAKESHKVTTFTPASIQNPVHLYIMSPQIGGAPLASLEMGRDANAIDGIGPEDYMSPPPVPDSDGNAFFLTNTGSDYVKTVRDIRSMTGDQEWILEIDQKLGIPAAISWDSTGFSNLTKAELVELDPATQMPLTGVSPISMKNKNSLQLQSSTDPSGSSRYFRIVLSTETSVTNWFDM